MSRLLVSLALSLVLLVIAPAHARAQMERAAPDAAAQWRALTELDLDAAYRLVRDNHPGAVPELGDDEFRRNLEAAIARWRARIAGVDGYAGYVAVLNGFAVSLGDKHIWSRQVLRLSAYEWAGLAMSYRGGSWHVVTDAQRGDDDSLQGATLVGCDGRSADNIAAERLGNFRGVWSIEAQRVQAAPFLFVDDGNPFLARPGTCEFTMGDARRSVQLEWMRVGPATLNARLGPALNIGSAGMGLREFAGGHWVGLETLDDAARAVVDEVKAKADELRRSPMVVLDLRGNGGGNSAFGDAIAVALLGETYVRAAMGHTPAPDCPALWRATPGNLAGLRAFVERSRPSMDPQNRAWWDASVGAVDAAVQAGRPFDGDLQPCPGVDDAEPPPANLAASPMTGRLVVLTDSQCFSSCLLVTQQFRRLGALHVGDATDAATRYMEVREELLPSGLSYASTLQKVATGAPRQIGPFVPAHRFEGAMDDTDALEAWVMGLR